MSDRPRWPVTAGATAAWLATVFAIGTDRRSLFVAVLLAGSVAVALTLPWRQLIVAVLALVLVEALPRRYLVNEVGLFFVKDAFLGVAYLKFALERRRSALALPRLQGPLGWGVALLAGVLLLEALNPNAVSPVVTAFGLHSVLWYLPLAWLIAEAGASLRVRLGALVVVALTALPLGVLAVLQLHNFAINDTYYYDVVGRTSITVDTAAYTDRAIGTFGSTGAFSDYLVFVGISGAALAAVARPRFYRLATVAAFVGMLLCLGGAGSRTLAASIVLACVALLALERRLSAAWLLPTACMLAIVGSAQLLYPQLPGLYRAVVFGLSPSSVSERLEGIPPQRGPSYGDDASEAPAKQAPASTPSRASTPTPGDAPPAAPVAPDAIRGLTASAPVRTTRLAWLIGHGLGMSTTGRDEVAGHLDPADAAVVRRAREESSWRAIYFESGFLGLLAYVFAGAAALFVLVRRYLQTQEGERALAGVGAVSLIVTAVLMGLAIKLGTSGFTIFLLASLGLGFSTLRRAEP
jgi:hypothetical protein